jgi:hypothetical protein
VGLSERYGLKVGGGRTSTFGHGDTSAKMFAWRWTFRIEVERLKQA